MEQMHNHKKILLFHVEEGKKTQIQFLCKHSGIDVIVVKPNQYEEELGALAGISGMKLSGKPYFGTEFSDEMMIFSGIDTEGLDMFLKLYRESGIAPIGLKAVITPTNVRWTPRQIHQELWKEHLEFLKNS